MKTTYIFINEWKNFLNEAISLSVMLSKWLLENLLSD